MKKLFIILFISFSASAGMSDIHLKTQEAVHDLLGTDQLSFIEMNFGAEQDQCAFVVESVVMLEETVTFECQVCFESLLQGFEAKSTSCSEVR